MKTDISKLKTFTNFGKVKGISRQRIHIAVLEGKLNTQEIDGVRFIVLDDKALSYKKRK
jgi:hypothetical protein